MKQFILNDGTTIEMLQEASVSKFYCTIAEQIENRCVETLTISEVATLLWLNNEGWKIRPNFYGLKVPDKGTDLIIGVNWLTFNGIHKDKLSKEEFERRDFHEQTDVINYAMYINTANNELWLYDASVGEEKPHLLAKFNCYSDFLCCVKNFNDYVPAKPCYDFSFGDEWNLNEKMFQNHDKVVDKIIRYLDVPWVVDLDKVRIVG